VSHTLKDLGLVDLQSSDGTDSQSHMPTPRFRVGYAELLLTLSRDKELPRFGAVDVIAFRRCLVAPLLLTGRKMIA
jgi:hypothetical protein